MKILELKEKGLNNSQIAKKLKISRGSVIGLLKGQTIPTPKIKPETAIITLWLRVENNSKFVRGKGQVRERIEQDSLREYQMKKLSNNEYELIFIYIGMMKTCKNKLTNCTGKCFRQPIYETVLSKPISMKKAWSVPFNNNLRIDREGTFQKRISQNCKMCVATSHRLCYDDASEVMLICQ